ncbi:MAG: cobalt ECF transporter T component CbiQ [Gemmiger sp.]|nr:cobalt ECF transporter T component CbiQ [Gemmiger sp.]
MGVTAILAAAVLFCLFAGSAAPLPLGAFCLAAGGVLLVVGHHHQDGPMLDIDRYARRSRLSGENAGAKLALALVLLAGCVCAHTVWPPLALFVAMLGLTVGVGGLPLGQYLALFSLPLAFLLLSGVGLLWGYTSVLPADAMLALRWPGGYLVVTAAAQAQARLVMARALGGVSCLYFLSLSTPLPEILAVLRKIHFPAIIIELATLIYRYIFLLLGSYYTMHAAAQSRLGYVGYKRSIRTTARVYQNLLAGSFRRAGACLDAMESRCYTGELRFLQQKKTLSTPAAACFCLLAALLLGAVGMGY